MKPLIRRKFKFIYNTTVNYIRDFNSIFFYGFDRLIYNKILHTVTFYKDFESKVKFHLLDIINMGYANSDYKLPLSDNSLQTFLI